jgi:hypothetical protein
MYERFEFPVQCQHWIVNRKTRIRNLTDSLSRRNVRDGDTIHLYLVAAQVLGITKDSALDFYQQTTNRKKCSRKLTFFAYVEIY